MGNRSLKQRLFDVSPVGHKVVACLLALVLVSSLSPSFAQAADGHGAAASESTTIDSTESPTQALSDEDVDETSGGLSQNSAIKESSTQADDNTEESVQPQVTSSGKEPVVQEYSADSSEAEISLMSEEDPQQDGGPDIMPMAVNEDIPTVDQSIIDDAANYPVVLIDSTTGVQVGCTGLADAWGKIGTTSTDDYQVVVIRDYTMVATTDQNAILANAGAAASLTLTSTYYPSDTPAASASATVSSSGDYSRDFNFQSAETLVHDFNFSCPSGCSRFLACGNKLTMGKGITITGANIQVFAGGSSNCSGPAEIDVQSGTYSIIFCGNYIGTFSGNIKATISGSTKVPSAANYGVYVGGQTPNAAGSSTELTLDGTDGNLDISNISGCLTNTAVSGTATVNLKNVTTGYCSPLYQNAGIKATVNVEGDVAVTQDTNCTDLNIAEDATYASRGLVTIAEDLTLASGATYSRTGNTAQTVSGDLKITGPDAAINLYKANATTAPVMMTVGGDYVGTDKLTVGFTNGTTAIAPTAAGGDLLFTYTTPANADAGDYHAIGDNVSHMVFDIVTDTGNVKTAARYAYPSYYLCKDADNNLFSFTALGQTSDASESTGLTHTEYRKYVNESGVWKVYVCDAAGTTTGDPIDPNIVDHPQPLTDAPVLDYSYAEGYMVRFDEVGRYRITACAGVNYDGIDGLCSGTASGTGSPLNSDGKGEQNSSWAILKQSTSTSSIYKAYLVMTTTLTSRNSMVNTTNATDRASRDRLLNTPMKLESAETGNSMLSNGYLPDDFSMVKARSTGDIEGTVTPDKPTMLRDYAGKWGVLGEAMTITDVTDFVKENGYGKYYGSDIPISGGDADAAIAWRLVVLESDPSMEYNRVVAMQMGPFTNGNTATGQTAASMKVDFGGYLTPSRGDFGGQVLFIGSDNLTGNTSGGSTGSNMHTKFFPGGDITDTGDAIPVGTNDASTPEVERPLSETQGDNWSQGQMDINGKKLTKDEVSFINDTITPGSMGIDLSLLDVTDKERKNDTWDTTGGHNLYLTRNSKAVAITSEKDTTGIGYLDVVAMSSDIEEPKFGATIIHTDISMTGLEGTDVVAGKPVKVKATAVNETPFVSKINGSLNTKFVVALDEKLSNLRAMDGTTVADDGDAIKATFHNYDETTNTNEPIQVTGVYSAADHTITFDFGTDYWDADAGVMRTLFNSKQGDGVDGDWIEVEFLADTDSAATIDDPDVNYTNSVIAKGADMILDNRYLATPEGVYAEAVDSFDTYHNLTRISKTTEGTYADMTKSFTFAVALKDSEGNYLPKGTKFDYKGGTLSGAGTAPADGTLTVGDNGVVIFGLTNDQFITITDLVTGSIVVTETDHAGYNVTWHDSTWPTTAHPSTEYETAVNGSTGDIAVLLSEGEVGDRTRYIDFINTKTEIVPSGINSRENRFFWFMILAIVLLSAVVIALSREYNVHKYVAVRSGTKGKG